MMKNAWRQEREQKYVSNDEEDERQGGRTITGETRGQESFHCFIASNAYGPRCTRRQPLMKEWCK